MTIETELNKPLKSQQVDLPPLPELEPLEAVISKVEFKADEFKGKPVYITDQNKVNILDSEGNPIPRKIFNITFDFKEYKIKNNEPRKAWLKVGASFNEKAKLPKLLEALRLKVSENPTPNEIITLLSGLNIKLQLKNNPKDGKIYQNIIFDTIRPLAAQEPIKTTEADWEP